MRTKIDKEGRATIPYPCRNKLGWKTGTKLLATIEDGKIVLTGEQAYCKLCGAHDELKETPELTICMTCIEKIKTI